MIQIQHLDVGTRLKLKSGAVVEVADNPRDGTWLVARPVGPDGVAAEATELVNADEVMELT